MIIKVDKQTFFVFDLDDTLYSEIDFLKSAYRFIAFRIDPTHSTKLYEEMLTIFTAGGNTFEYILREYPGKVHKMSELLDLFHYHKPQISLKKGAMEILLKIKSNNGRVGLITNGRSITQRNKIEALGLEQIFDIIIISEEIGFEKPAPEVYKWYLDSKETLRYYYFGDNYKNDFIMPVKYGWCCIGVIGENNIHKLKISDFSYENLPHIFIRDYNEIEIL